MSSTLTTASRSLGRTLVPPGCGTGAAYLGLYLLLDWSSYVEPLSHTSITPRNPNTGVVMAALLGRGAGIKPVMLWDEIRRNKRALVQMRMAPRR